MSKSANVAHWTWAIKRQIANGTFDPGVHMQPERLLGTPRRIKQFDRIALCLARKYGEVERVR